MEDIKKIKLPEIKTAMSGETMTLEGVNSRSDTAEPKMSEAEVRARENTQNKQSKET